LTVLTIEKFILKIQDAGGCHLEKYKNHYISATVQAIFMKFGPMTHYMYIIRTNHNCLISFVFGVFMFFNSGASQ